MKKRDEEVPGSVALNTLIASNALVFGCGQLQARGANSKNPWMSKHFLCSRLHLRNWQWHTLLTSCFYHLSPAHFLFNSLAMWTIGRVAAEQLSHLCQCAKSDVCFTPDF